MSKTFMTASSPTRAPPTPATIRPARAGSSSTSATAASTSTGIRSTAPGPNPGRLGRISAASTRNAASPVTIRPTTRRHRLGSPAVGAPDSTARVRVSPRSRSMNRKCVPRLSVGLVRPPPVSPAGHANVREVTRPRAGHRFNLGVRSEPQPCPDHEVNVMIGTLGRGFRHGRLLCWRASVGAGRRPSRRPGVRAPSLCGWRSPSRPGSPQDRCAGRERDCPPRTDRSGVTGRTAAGPRRRSGAPRPGSPGGPGSTGTGRR